MTSPLSPRSPPSQPPKPKLIGDLDFAVLKRLGDRLDMPGEGNWRKLISVLPGTTYDQTTVERFGLNANRPGGSPGYALLTDLSNRGIGYDVLVTGLKRLHFGAALTDLGYREEVKFKVQPVATPAIEGQRVELSCEATGVPLPAYLWFKGREPLSEQVSSVLVIEIVSKTDAAMYTCRATNDVNTVFSNWAEIIVQKPPVLRSQAIPGSIQKVTDIPQLISYPDSSINSHVNADFSLSVIANVPSGAHLSYQWYRDSVPLKFGTSSDLVITNAQLKDSGNYNCSVTSDLGGSVLTPNCSVTVRPPGVVQAPLNPSVSMSQPHLSQGAMNQASLNQAPLNQAPLNQAPLNQGHMNQGYMNQGHSNQEHLTQVRAPPTPSDVRAGGGNRYQQCFDEQRTEANLPHGMGYPPQVQPVYPADYQLVPPGQYMHQPGMVEGYGGQYYTHGQTGEVFEVDRSQGLVDDEPRGQDQPDLDDLCYDKVALLVGNKNYRKGELKLNTPDRDAQDLAGVLQSAGFKVVSLIDLSKREMEKAVEYFTTLIGKNVYALFFFAGHGFEFKSLNYMMPVDADVEKKPDQCLCAQDVLQAMQISGAKLSIMILDMCRVCASASSTPMDYSQQLNFVPPSGATGYFLLAFSCTSTERAYEASTDAEALKEQDKHNSIFVSALKEHLDNGTLHERLDTLLSDAAARVRERGRSLRASAIGWMRPEIRHNMAGALSLADEIKRGPEIDSQRDEKSMLWRNAHIVPESIVLGCHSSDASGAKPSEIALRLHFEAEHSNVLIVTVELLNGCLAQVDVHRMSMAILQDGIPHHPKLKASDFDKQYRFSDCGTYGYRADHIPRPNDILHFRIPELQKIRSPTVKLEIEVEYVIQRPGSQRHNRLAILTSNLAPPLYSKVTVHGPTVSTPANYDIGYNGSGQLP